MKLATTQESKKSHRFFCTHFNKKYLIAGLAMIESLMRNCDNCVIYVLCMDLDTYDFIRKLDIKGIVLIKEDSIISHELLSAKRNRNFREYCWTLSSYFTHYILIMYPEIKLLTYVDADLFFYSSVEAIFEEINEASIAVTKHNFSNEFIAQEKNGIFCVQWVTFRSDKIGLACLTEWRDQCLNWCYNFNSNGRMGDQKYLDLWPNKYNNICIIKNLGAGVAPWNFNSYKFNKINNKIMINKKTAVIFYHFHQFKIFNGFIFRRLPSVYLVNAIEPKMIYDAYEKKLVALIKKFRVYDSLFYNKYAFLYKLKLFLVSVTPSHYLNKIKAKLWFLR